MCGRAYATFTDEELELRYKNRKPAKLPKFKPNYNIAPSQNVIVLRTLEDGSRFDPLRWGLVPFWADDVKIGYKMINARAETIAEKPSFRNAFKKRRCIVPLTGFFEWHRTEEAKKPFRIFVKNQPIMSVAGIWEKWEPEDGEVVQSFSIITTESNAFMTKIHDRMPVILDVKNEDEWLDPKNDDVDALKKLLKPCPAKWLDAVEISQLVNSPKNNRAEVLDAVSTATRKNPK